MTDGNCFHSFEINYSTSSNLLLNNPQTFT